MVAKLSPAAIWGGDSIPLVADRLGNALPGRSLNPPAQAVCKRVIEGVYGGDLLLGDLHRVLDPVEAEKLVVFDGQIAGSPVLVPRLAHGTHVDDHVDFIPQKEVGDPFRFEGKKLIINVGSFVDEDTGLGIPGLAITLEEGDGTRDHP